MPFPAAQIHLNVTFEYFELSLVLKLGHMHGKHSM